MSLFKSVFVRYLITFVLIILLSFFLLALILSYMMKGNSEQMTMQDLEQAAKSVSDLLTEDIKNTTYLSFPDYVLNNYNDVKGRISAVTRYTSELYVFVVDTDGNILITDDQIADGYLTGNIPGELMAKLNGGETPSREEFWSVFSEASFFYSEIIERSTGSCEGFVIASRPVVKATNFISQTVRTIIMACMWVMTAAIIASYFISERIARPMRDMSRAAKEFAAGHFDVRVAVRGNDEISQLAAAFNNMASDLETLEQTRRTFLANVSHDLRSPMTSIAGFVDGMLDGAIPPEKYRHYLGVISSEVRRLARLVSLLLDISRIQAGERKFNMVSFDICEMARQILISFEQRIDEKKLDVEFECDEDNMFVIADTDAIHQIIYNICDNAIKFSFDGGLYRISIHYKDKKVVFSVYNEGIGISKEDLPYVFERFYKADKSRGMDKTGVGLGMYISRTIIEAHNETIKVNSEQGKYCEFVFTLKRDTSK